MTPINMEPFNKALSEYMQRDNVATEEELLERLEAVGRGDNYDLPDEEVYAYLQGAEIPIHPGFYRRLQKALNLTMQETMFLFWTHNMGNDDYSWDRQPSTEKARENFKTREREFYR